jgi:23S rRNA pseudouridine1911/1915/1917 synthase
MYKDREITVVLKPAAIVSEQTEAGDGLADLLAARNPKGYVGVVHRLDRGVSGVMVYARTPRAAAKLSAAVQAHTFQKEYLAWVHGVPAPSGTLRDLLFHDRMKNKTFVVERERRGVKEALLDYACVKTLTDASGASRTLVSVRLHTGRTHQIRVQFAHRGHPLVGDGKYGARGDRAQIALFCYRLHFPHPTTGEPLTFTHVWDRAEEHTEETENS